MWMTNRPEWIFALYATTKIGAVLVPINTRYAAATPKSAIDQSDASTLIFNDRSGPVNYAATVRKIQRDLPNVQRIVVLGADRDPGWHDWEAMVEAGRTIDDQQLAARADAVNAGDPMIVIYTSVTTSRPKGAVHDHTVLRNVVERIQMHGVTVDDVHGGFLPLFHTFGFTESALFTALSGGRLVLFEAFDPDVVLDAAEREGITMIHGFDTHWGDLLRAQRARPRTLRCASGRSPPDSSRRHQSPGRCRANCARPCRAGA